MSNKIHAVEYSDLIPDIENQFQLFKSSWTSRIPQIKLSPGSIPLFEDSRILWFIEKMGSINNLRVLELGPLEGGHSYMLENHGAEVTAIEANVNAFLRCLIVKNHFNLKTQFILGDFTKLQTGSKYDMVVASGVLYHMTDPVGLLKKLSAISPVLFLWTHYFEPDTKKWAPELQSQIGIKWRPDLMKIDQSLGFLNIRIVPQNYNESLGWEGFCGGPEKYSHWIYKEDLLSALRELGYDQLEISFDNPLHPNGPSCCILAQKGNESN
jgi:hypothetical protein